MNQRTCNIIRCCKGACELVSETTQPMDAIAAYMSKECGCPVRDYKGRLMESILMEAMFDFFSTADNPEYELRQLFHQYANHEPSLNERICTMFQLTKVYDHAEGKYVNGFTDELMARSEKDLKPEDKPEQSDAG